MPVKLAQLLRKSPAMIAVAALFLALLCGACVENPLADPPVKEPENKVFNQPYDDVWRAIQLALRKYPVRLNNIESGILETDYVKGEQIFSDPIPGRSKPGMRYKLTVRAVRGKIEGRHAVKVVCSKQEEIQPDFFTGFQPLPSNGLEERAILYRISRYIELDRILSKPKNGSNAIFNDD